jgi:hypothetical protein
MSDLQDIIATNTIRAFNQGFDQGGREERRRIVELLTEAIERNGKDSWLDALALIAEENK